MQYCMVFLNFMAKEVCASLTFWQLIKLNNIAVPQQLIISNYEENIPESNLNYMNL